MSQRSDRLYSVSLLLMVIIIIGLLIEPVYDQYKSNQIEIHHLSERLHRSQELTKQGLQLQAALEELQSERDTQNYFITGNSTRLAEAKLQSLIRSTHEETGLYLSSTQVVRNNDQDAPVISMRVTSEGNLEQIRNTINALENGPTLLFIDRVTINKTQKRQANRQAANGHLNNKLQLRIEVSGLAEVEDL